MRGCACRGTAGFAHVSCLAEQAKILLAEAEENNLGNKAFNERWPRWFKCGLCEQEYHGVVSCALGWACWKTYVGTISARQLRRSRTRNGSRGVCLAARTRRRRELSAIYESREPCSAPAKRLRRLPRMRFGRRRRNAPRRKRSSPRRSPTRLRGRLNELANVSQKLTRTAPPA